MKLSLPKAVSVAVLLLIANLFFAGTAIAQTNYYYKGTGNLNATASWGQNTNGTGTAPSNFTAASQVFNIRNTAAVSNSGTWTVSGAGSKIIAGDGTNACNLTIPTGANTIVGTVDVAAAATLTLTNTTLPTLGTLNAASTVVYNGTATQNITQVTYGNLGYSGSSTATFAGSGTYTIAGNFFCTSGNVTFNNSGTARTFNIAGDFSMSSAGNIEFGSAAGSGVINLSGDFSKTNGVMTTTTATNNEVFNMTGTSQTMQSTSTGTLLKWVNFTIATGSTCTLVGDFNETGSSGTAGVITVSSGGTLVTGTSNIIGVFSTFTLSAGATLQVGSALGITTSGANGNIQTVTRTYSAGANYVYNGAANQVTGNGLTANTAANLTIDNANTVTLSAATSISGNLLISQGTLATNNFNTTVSGNWTNNGSFTAGTGNVTFSGATQAIGGTNSTAFAGLIIDDGSVTTMNNSNSSSSLTFNSAGSNTSLTLGVSNPTLTVNGAVTITQPGTTGVTTSWNINGGTATVSGLVATTGTSAANRITKITITTGTLNANGGITFTGSTATNKVIDMSGGAGTINLKGALTQATSTLTSSSTSIFNYNDATNAQTINFFSAGSYSNLAINNTSSGGATLSAAITASNVTQALSVQSGKLNNGTFAITLASGKNFSVSNAATFNLTNTSTMVTVSGGGTKTFGATSTVSYTGAAQAVTVESYGNLVLSGSSTKTFAGATTVAGNFSISGTIANLPAGSNSSANTVTIGGVAQPLGSFGGNTSGANYIYPAYFAATTGKISSTVAGCTAGAWIGGTSTDWFTASNWCSNAVPTSATDVIIQSGTPFQPTINAAAACKDITINSGATLTISGSNSLTVSGNWDNKGSFTANTSTVTFNGSSTQLLGGTATSAFNNLTINESSPSVQVINDSLPDGSGLVFSVAGNLTVTQGNLVLKANNASYTVLGNLTVAANGTLSHNVSWDIYGVQITVTGNVAIDGTYTVTSRGHISMIGSGKFIHSTSPLSILTLATAGSITADGPLNVNDNFWAMFGVTGGNFFTNGQTINANAGMLISGGTVNVNGGNLNVTTGLSVGMNGVGGNLAYTAGNITTDFLTVGDGGATATGIGTITQSSGTNLVVNGGVTINQQQGVTATNTWNINAGTATVSGVITFAGASATANRIGKIAITTGTLNANGGMTFVASLAANKVVDMSGGAGTLKLKGALTVPGASSTLTSSTTSIFDYIDANAQTINFFSAGAYSNLNINNTNASGATLSAAITAANVTGNLSVGNVNTASLFNTNNLAVTFGASKTLTVAAASTMNAGTSVVGFGATGNAAINGTFKTANTVGFSGAATTAINSTNTPTITLGTVSTIEYSATANQVVTIRTYNNLAFSGSGNKTVASGLTISKNLSISGSAVALLANGTTSTALTLTFAGVNQVTGSWGGTTSSATNQNGTRFGTTTTGILNVNISCTAGTWVGTFSTDWNDVGNWCGGLPTAVTDVTIASTAPNQPVIGVAGGLCRNLTIGIGASLGFTSGNLTVSGNWANNGGTFTPGTGTVTFNSTTAAQSIGGTVATQTFNNIIVNKSGQSLTMAGSTTLVEASGTLTLTAGVVNAGANTISVTNSAAGSVVRTSGYVTGNLKRAIATGTNTYDFAVGTTAAGYTPASFAFTGITGAGTINIVAADGVGSNYPASLNATKKLARNWTATNAGVTGIAGSATFTYISPTDLAGGAVSGNLKAYVYNGAASYPTSNSNTSNSFTFTGLTTLGEFGAGECKGTLAPTFTKTMASSCGGGADGSITVTPAGGTAPYTYSWTSTPGGFTASTAAITGLAPKDYTVVVAEVTTCLSAIPDITIWQALAPTITHSGSGSGSCGNTGSIILYAANGVAPFTYSIDGVTYQAGNTFTNVAGGTYTGYVKDLRNCITTKPGIVVTSAAAIVVTANTRPASSCGNTGVIELYRTGGVAPYTYSLNDVTYQASNTFTNLAGATTYTGWVKDSKGCKTSLGGITVAKATALTVTQSHTNASACGNDGTITLHGAGGVPGYTYSKVGAAGPYQGSNTFTAVAAGSYTCWIQDSKGCKNLVSVTVGSTVAMTMSVTTSNSGGCNNAGKIHLFRNSGGTAPFTYSINNITYQSSPVFTGLASGTYTGYIKDATGCTISQGGINLTGVSAVSATASHTNSSTCVNDGTIQLRPAGGVAPYTYSLDDVTYVGSPYFSSLATGSYTGWVKDANGCKASVAITVAYNFVALTAYAGAASNCAASNGSIQLFVTGGVNPYTFSIDGVTFQSSNVFSGLVPGDYDGYVMDAKGCIGTLLNINVGPACPRPVTIANKATSITTTKADLSKVEVAAKTSLTVQAYPNPSTTEFTLKLQSNSHAKVSITVTDLMGRNVLKLESAAGKLIRFGHELKAGVYLVQVVQGGEQQSVKVVKE